MSAVAVAESLLRRENRAIEFASKYALREHAREPLHQPPQIARANGIDICYEIFGDANAEPMLLIMGLGAQMIHWDDEFCEQLAARGFRVIRFDNRDIGKSSKLTGGKRLTPLELLKLRFLKIPGGRTLQADRHGEGHVGLMDALGIKSAHLVGASMGGMIAQEVAISFPERVRSLTSIMSTTGNPQVPPPTREAAAMLMAPPPRPRRNIIVRFAPDLESAARRLLSGRRGARSRSRRTHVRARAQSGRRRPAAPRRARLRQPQGAAACA